MDNDLSWNIKYILTEYKKTLVGKIQEDTHNYRIKYIAHENTI